MNSRKQLAKEFSTPARKVMPMGRQFLEQSVFSEEVFCHRTKELRLQSFLKKRLLENMPWEKALEMACLDAGVTQDWAKGYFKSPRYQKWLADRMEELEINAGATQEWLISQHVLNINGHSRFNDSQMKSLVEVGERLWPKVTRLEHKVETEGAASLDELAKVQEEVAALEERLKTAVQTREAA